MNESNQINKPMSLLQEEFNTALIKLCNDSHLPLFVIEYNLKDLLQEVHLIAKRQLESDKKQYEDALNNIQDTNNISK